LRKRQKERERERRERERERKKRERQQLADSSNTGRQTDRQTVSQSVRHTDNPFSSFSSTDVAYTIERVGQMIGTRGEKKEKKD
jgi:ribosomal protein L9